MTGTRWADIPGYEGLYQVSDDGRVRRLLSTRPHKELKPTPAKRGKYLTVTLCRDAIKSRRTIHTLVATAFLPKPPGAQLVRHLDSNKHNNHVTNLAWGTYLDNEADKAPLGRTNHGEHDGMCKLTDQQVDEIRAQYAAGVSPSEIARQYGVNRSYPARLVSGRKRAKRTPART